MKPLFKKAALTAVAAGVLTGVSMDASAIITGAVGEALLVPLVVADTDVNTVVTVVTPAEVYNDTVPNYFTAPNTTPGAGDFAGAKGSLHWYFFDKGSNHLKNKAIPVTADDYTVIDWSTEATGGLRGEVGYLVIGTESARLSGGEASFDMHGDAQLILEDGETVIAVTDIPVLPMSDGVDPAGCFPTMINQVCYRGSGSNRVPSAVSPLGAGVRMNWFDSDTLDLTVIDLALHGQDDSLHVLWLDGNYGDDGYDGLDVVYYDPNEVPCSGTISAPNELNLVQIYTSGTLANVWPFDVTQVENLCGPDYTAYLRVSLPEVLPGTLANPVAQSGVFFSLLTDDTDEDLFTVPAGELAIDIID